MIALLRSELRRLFSRRIVKALVVFTLIGIAITCTIIAVQSHPPSDADRAFAEQRSAADREFCIEDEGFGPIPEGETREEFCRRVIRPEHYLPSSLFGIGNLPTILEGTSFLIAIGGWLVGASFVGAEWQAGSMATLLTWEPRRLRVLAGKVLAGAAGVFLVTMALEVIFASALWLVAATRGSTAGAGGTFARTLVELMLRISAVTAFGAVLGLALATIARNTGAAIGIAFAYLAVAESLIRALKPAWQPWLIGDNANVFVLGREGIPGIGRSVWEAGLVLLLYVGVFFVAATASFRGRDVN